MRKRPRIAVLLGLVGSLTVAQGCATLTGTFTGPYTGLVDGPAQLSRLIEDEPGQKPALWVCNVLIIAPASFAGGTVFGFAKGLTSDINVWFGSGTYGSVFGRYEEDSVWRPYSWEHPMELQVSTF